MMVKIHKKIFSFHMKTFYFTFLQTCANSPLGKSSITFLKKNTHKKKHTQKNNTKNIFYLKNITKISPEVVRHMNDVHNSSKTIVITLKNFCFTFTNGANCPGVNSPVRKMVLEQTVPGGTGFGVNCPVTGF